MNITPLEIRQKAFETHFRGYDKDEVDAFLLSLSQEWERLNGNMRDHQIRMESTEKELNKLREVESSLFKTLKTAEDTSNNMISQANKSAELQMRETLMNTEALVNDARVLAKDMIDEAEAAIKDSYELMKDQVKALEQDFKALENHRESLISELKSLSASVLERAERSEKQKFDLSVKLDINRSVNLKEVLDPVNQAINNIAKQKTLLEPKTKIQEKNEEIPKKELIEKREEEKAVVQEEVSSEKQSETKDNNNSEKSFFDLD